MVTVAVIVLTFSMPALPQPQEYHDFADQRTFLGLPHFFNVVSNLAFFVEGLWGYYLLKTDRLSSLSSQKFTYAIFFAAIVMVSFGSVYYHLNPDNMTLVWDRIPITVAFMALFSFVIAEFISESFALKLRFVFIILGVVSVLLWAYSEILQRGDLRLYLLVQLIPLVLMPIIVLRFESKFTHKRIYIYLLLTYIVAKLFELYDVQIYELLALSGHTLKHLMAAFGIWLLIAGMQKRQMNLDH